jgi:hypothetical protein
MNLDRRPDNHEAAMARADLYKLANYSMKLFKMIQEGQELEGWVQAKITKAADYIASVYHFMEYEMKVSEYGETLENSDVYSESVRRAFQQKLMEAKKKAEKVKKEADKVEEGFDDLEKYMKEKDKPQPKGGAGKKQGSKYGGSKQKDDEDKEKDVKEGFEDMQKWLKDKRGPQPSGSAGKKQGTRYGGSKQADDKDDDENEGKKKDKKVKESAKPDYLDFDKDGNKKEPMKKALKDKKVKEGASCSQTMEGKSCPVHGMKECPMEEAAKPSAGLSKEKKSSVVKAAKTGKDIGKPGKNFDKVAAAAKKGGAKDPKAVAAAAMWKNVKK